MKDVIDKRLAEACFLVSCVVGLIGAFIGLNASSLWIDELFTAWTVGHDRNAVHMIGRVLSDVHPPLYYIIVFGFSELFGSSDVALRLFSALCACGAVLIFLLSTPFSRPARLFAAALATGSGFWFYQAQNARDYPLSLLIGAGILALSLRLLRDRMDADKPRPTALLVGLLALMLTGSFVHFYLMFECFSVLVILAVFIPRLRLIFAVMFGVILVSAGAYLQLVIKHYAQMFDALGWIRNTPDYLKGQFQSAILQTTNAVAILALLLCLGAAVLAWLQSRTAGGPSPSRPAPTPPPGAWPIDRFTTRLSPVLTLCLAVPLMVAAGGVLSSMVMAPNVSDRNILIASPFLWGLFAAIYEAGPERSRPPVRTLVNLALAVLVLFMGTIVLSRRLPRNEPFRASADFVRSFPACKGQPIPVVLLDTVGKKEQGFFIRLSDEEYDRYLKGWAAPEAVFLDDLDAGRVDGGLKSALSSRLGGAGCPVVGWSAHNFTAGEVGSVSAALAAAAGQPAAASRIKAQSFTIYRFGLRRTPMTAMTYVLYASPPPPTPAPQPKKSRRHHRR